jgi:integrase
MPTTKLTKTKVERLEAPTSTGKQILYWDADNKGLGVLCSGKSNVKSWVVQANLNGKARRITIGPTNVLDPAQAWERAKPILSDIFAGVDPKAERKRKAQANVTVEQVLTAYLAQPRLAASSVEFYRRTADRHLSQWLERSLRSITPDDVQQRFQAIERDVAERQAAGRVRGGVNVTGQGSANLAMQLFSSLWNYQVERDETLGRNPTIRLRKQWHKLERRKRRVWDDDFPQFYQAALALPNPIQRDLVVFGLFTGMRENEAAGLKWEEVDFRHRIIRLPSSRMKAREPFELPMSDYVYDLLVARRAIGWDGPYVFPGNSKSGHCEAFAAALGQIRQVTGLQISPHDLRRTFVSVASNCEIPPIALKLLIAHTVGNDVTAGYTIFSPADLKRAAQKVADRMIELCKIEAPQADNVTRLG